MEVQLSNAPMNALDLFRGKLECTRVPVECLADTSEYGLPLLYVPTCSCVKYRFSLEVRKIIPTTDCNVKSESMLLLQCGKFYPVRTTFSIIP